MESSVGSDQRLSQYAESAATGAERLTAAEVPEEWRADLDRLALPAIDLVARSEEMVRSGIHMRAR